MRRILAPPPPPGLRSGPVPTFSVLIRTYQAADTILGAVESALAQTLPPHEVIVVDDGSTDRTAEILRPYGDRIAYLRQDNRGAAAAANEGARRATGEFVAILDADDVYEPERLEALTELAVRRPDLDILMTDAHFEVAGRVTSRFCTATPFATTDQNVAIFERCFIAWPAIRRRTLLAAGGFDESLRVGHDWEAWIRLLHSGCKAGTVDEPLMRYRITGQGSLTDDRVGALRGRVQMLERASALDLTADERGTLEYFLARRRRRLLFAETERALRERSPEARRLAIRLSLSSGVSAGVRTRALAAAIAPRAAARRLAALEAKRGYSNVKRRLPVA